ncbi:MAG: hypothetical protein ACOX3W_02705 [Christensenellaceae bacterium]
MPTLILPFGKTSTHSAEVNEILLDAPEAINEDAYAAWLVELSEVDSDFSDLLDGTAYAVLLEEEG